MVERYILLQILSIFYEIGVRFLWLIFRQFHASKRIHTLLQLSSIYLVQATLSKSIVCLFLGMYFMDVWREIPNTFPQTISKPWFWIYLHILFSSNKPEIYFLQNRFLCSCLWCHRLHLFFTPPARTDYTSFMWWGLIHFESFCHLSPQIQALATFKKTDQELNAFNERARNKLGALRLQERVPLLVPDKDAIPFQEEMRNFKIS